MVSMIEVIPEEVRGYGNIMGVKSVEDFTPVNSELTLEEDIYILTAVSGVHISLTASSSSIDVGSSVTLTATVMEDDSPVTGVSVSFYDGETLLGSEDTDSEGVAAYTTSSLTVGSHSLSAVYDDSTSNVVTVTVSDVPTPTPASVSLTSDKSILSYADSESATLSATVLDSNDDPIEGVTVTFYNGSTSMGTADTNSSGVATKTYASAGSGDVSLTAEVGSLVSETYAIEDCYLYDNSISDKHSNWTTSSEVTITHDTGYYIITTTGQDKLVSFANNLDNVRFELVIKAPNNTNDAGIHIGTSPTSYGTAVQMYYNTNFGIVYRTNGSWSAGTRQQSPIPVRTDWNRFILEMNGNNFHAICQTEEDTPTVIFNHSNTKSGISTKYYNMCIGSAQTCHLKEIKIKPL